jgi:hypothetical protein
MPSFNTGFTYNVSGMFGQNIEETIKRTLHLNAKELGYTLIDRIVDRTQIMTGALQSSITFDDNPGDFDNPELLFLYANEDEQIAQWGRVYVQYQEGGALGMQTYTNPPREMFAKVLTDDLDDIADWGVKYCQEALDLCTEGKGVPL